MKKADLIFNFISFPVDFLMLLYSGLCAYFLRFETIAALRPILYDMPFNRYFWQLLLISFIWLIIFALSGLYTNRPEQKWTREFSKIFFACSSGVMLIIIAVFIKRDLFSSRFIILTGWILAIIFVVLGRLILRQLKHLLFNREIGIHHIILAGNDRITNDLAKSFAQNLKLGYKVIEQIKNPNEINFEFLEKTKNKYAPYFIDEIIQADANFPKEKSLVLLDFCQQNHLIFKYAADLFEAQAININIEAVLGIPLIEIKRTPLDGWGRIIKKVVDLIGSVIGLIILSPLFLVIAILIKKDSDGPVFVNLKRVGERGQVFSLYKFRSMIKDAHLLTNQLLEQNERTGPLFKIKNDPRITKIGKFIRRTSIDELPQLFNVLKGEMSLVGPRPHEPQEVNLYEKRHRKLLTIKPGITGMAQISGRSNLDFEDEARIDSFYIENWSLGLDLQILLKTPKVVLSAEGAV